MVTKQLSSLLTPKGLQGAVARGWQRTIPDENLRDRPLGLFIPTLPVCSAVLSNLLYQCLENGYSPFEDLMNSG